MPVNSTVLVNMFSFKNILQVSVKLTNTTLVNSTRKYQNRNALPLINQFLTRHINICSSLGARVAFKLSDIGEGIREVVVKEWFVKVGDKVNQFDNICEVQSDKASVTITSRYDGTISKLYYTIDDIALVGKPLVDIETDQTDGEEPKTTSLQVEEIQTEKIENPKETENDILNQYLITTDALNSAESTESQTSQLCIPSVRRLAKEHKLNLASIKGSGKNGRILKEDVLEYISKAPIEKSPISSENERKPIKGFHKVMVKTMTDSLVGKIPQFGYSDEIKVTKLSELRKSLKELPDFKGVKISYLPFFIKAVSNALQRYPVINASVDDHCENIIYNKNHNIGVAMDTKAGLAVPVIKNVERLNIMEIVSELNRLMESGKDGVFSPNDLTNGTFTISNIGVIGGTYTKPLILPPQVAIIALGASQVLPRFDEQKNIIAEEIVNISGAADHRVIDGATMARFTQILKKQIEEPNLLFLNV